MVGESKADGLKVEEEISRKGLFLFKLKLFYSKHMTSASSNIERHRLKKTIRLQRFGKCSVYIV